MTYKYIKVNEKVAEHLGLKADRKKLQDGSYLLWQFDLMPLGGNNDETIERVGGVGLTAQQAKEESSGAVCRPMPTATDPQFVTHKNMEE